MEQKLIQKNKKYLSPAVGHEISCVMKNINPEFLKDNKKLTALLITALKKDKFTILDAISHSFEPQGYTALILLAESHLALHTYPEHDSVYFNMYSCRGPNDAKKVFQTIKSALAPKEILHYAENKVPVKI